MFQKEELEQIRGVIVEAVPPIVLEIVNNVVHKEIILSEKRTEDRLTTIIEQKIGESEKRSRQFSKEIADESEKRSRQFSKEIADESEKRSRQFSKEIADESESRMESKINQIVKKEVCESEDRLINMIGTMFEMNIFPQFDEIRFDIAQIKQEIGFIKAKMITEFDLVDRLADFRLSLKGVF